MWNAFSLKLESAFQKKLFFAFLCETSFADAKDLSRRKDETPNQGGNGPDDDLLGILLVGLGQSHWNFFVRPFLQSCTNYGMIYGIKLCRYKAGFHTVPCILDSQNI